MEADNLPVM